MMYDKQTHSVIFYTHLCHTCHIYATWVIQRGYQQSLGNRRCTGLLYITLFFLLFTGQIITGLNIYGHIHSTTSNKHTYTVAYYYIQFKLNLMLFFLNITINFHMKYFISIHFCLASQTFFNIYPKQQIRLPGMFC